MEAKVLKSHGMTVRDLKAWLDGVNESDLVAVFDARDSPGYRLAMISSKVGKAIEGSSRVEEAPRNYRGPDAVGLIVFS